MTGWQLIETMPEYKYHIVGRWCGVGIFPYWNQVLANWFIFKESRCWSYEQPNRESVFFDDAGNYAEPTHWHEIPQPPESTSQPTGEQNGAN